MPPNDLPTPEDFIYDTGHSKEHDRKTIALIDVALGEWQRIKNIDTTIAVYKTCRRWLNSKDKKDSKNSLKRKTEVKKVITGCLEWISEFDDALYRALHGFNQNKATYQQNVANYASKNYGGPYGKAKEMASVYKHERSLYLKSDKTRAPSASKLDPEFDRYKDQLDSRRFAKKPEDFGDLTEDQYAQLDRLTGGGNDVIYLKKFHRLRCMVIPQNQLLYDITGSPFTTDQQYGWPYAMDKYGNLFSTDDRAAQGQFNHSSFNAGKDVICAGFIKVNQGRVLLISNNSGHYKPSQLHLYNAGEVLREKLGIAGISNTLVELHDYSTPGMFRVYEFKFNNFRKVGFTGGNMVLERILSLS